MQTITPEVLGPEATRTADALRGVRADLTPETETELMNAICAFVDALKAKGLRAEQVVILMNRMMNENGMERSLNDVNLLMDRAIRTCIVQFYKT